MAIRSRRLVNYTNLMQSTHDFQWFIKHSAIYLLVMSNIVAALFLKTKIKCTLPAIKDGVQLFCLVGKSGLLLAINPCRLLVL